MQMQLSTSGEAGQSDVQSDDLFRNSALYREFLAEREEILRHKWIESEKVGHDIGFERAMLDWILRHRGAWRTERIEQKRMPLAAT